MQEGGQLDSNPTEPKPRSRYRYRSAFWGVVLVAIGVVLLLHNLEVISGENLAMLALLWPILIIGIGVDLLLGRRSWALGGLIGVITVGLIVVFMLVGPGLGWAGDTDLKTQSFTTPVSQATSAHVAFDSSSYGADVHALEASAGPDRLLLDATVSYQGSVEFETSGEQQKTVTIETKGRRWWWGWLDLDDADPWKIGLDPALPLSLSVESSTGSSHLDLAGLRLTGLELDMSAGRTQLALPAVEGQGYPVKLHLSSGDLEVEAAPNARIDMSVDMSSGDARVVLGAESDINLTFDGSSGQFTVVLPERQAIRVDVRDVSSGDVDLPSGLNRVAGGDGDEGTWETEGYAAAAHKVLLIIESMSAGDVDVRQEG